ncbi:MAG: PD40 domain-containing protein [Gemmatimonadetes bacterium]|nr:PD40 domain-containing protein [Gemmatimonadota bacterium]
MSAPLFADAQAFRTPRPHRTLQSHGLARRDTPVVVAPFRRPSRVTPTLVWLMAGIVATWPHARPLDAQATSTAVPAPWDVTAAQGRTRTISFTTDEGTWLSPDVSPDGRTIAFDMVGDIWTVPIAGGTARSLTASAGIALDFHASFSPEGAQIAFISDRDGQNNIWVMNADGSNPRQVSRQREKRMALPTWTPDGNYIIARTGGDSNNDGRGELWMWHVDGGTGVRLTSDSLNASWPEVSPDGRFVFFEEIVSIPGDRNPARGLYQLRRLDRETGRIAEITNGVGPLQDGGGGRRSSGGTIAPAISPDGRWLAFARRIADGTQMVAGHEYGPRTALWLRDLQSGAERLVMDPITPDVQERNNIGALPRYSWMPDGRSILIPEGGKLRRLDIASGNVSTIPFSARVEQVISEQANTPIRVADGPLDVHMLRYHTASPDGRVLAFVAVGKIWLKELPNGTPRRLTAADFAADEYAPAWSPDGQWLAYTSWSDVDHGHLWKIPRAGGTPVRLSQVPGMYLNPTWSPDGARLVVARGTGEMLRGRMPSDEVSFTLESVPAAGGAAQPIVEVTSRGGKVVAPKFGPGGRIFYLETSRGSGAVLRSVRPDGLDERRHMILDAVDEASPSPDGKWLAFSRGDNLHLAPLPWPGVAGEPLHLTVVSPRVTVRKLSLDGGNFPNWIGRSVVEWGSANGYFRHHLDSRVTDSIPVTLQVPRAGARGTMAFTGARLVTMDGDQVIDRGDLVIENGRITAVGASGTVTIPAGARRIDADGATIIPGLVDAHKHTTREGRDLLSQQSWEMASNLAFGITTALEPSGTPEAIFAMAEAVEAGRQVGPRMYSAGTSLSSGTATRRGSVETLEDARHEVARLKSYGARAIKEYQQRRRDQRQKVVIATREAGLMSTCEGDADHLEYISIAMDGHTGCEHPILTLPLQRDVTQFLGQAGFFYSPTLNVGGPGPWGEDFFYQESDIWKNPKLQRFVPPLWLYPHTQRRTMRPLTTYPFPIVVQGVADIVAAGGFGTIGAHGQLQGIDSHFELWQMAAAMTPLQALRTATLFPAKFIGVDRDVGSLTVGKLADLVVLNSNPLENIRNTTDIRYVVKGGTMYDGNTLDQLWPDARAFPKMFWDGRK